jgi:putative PIN family toxin of toxin-antitoxin system
MVYAVIDTNVLVSAILSVHPDSSTVVVRDKIAEGEIVPLYNDEIFSEYRTVLTRPKFGFPLDVVDAVLQIVLEKGITLDRTKTDELFPDPKDVVFYEVALSKEGAYLVTGNIKHFPKKPIVVTPSELLDIIRKSK